jgi:hypothetical protein
MWLVQLRMRFTFKRLIRNLIGIRGFMGLVYREFSSLEVYLYHLGEEGVTINFENSHKRFETKKVH